MWSLAGVFMTMCLCVCVYMGAFLLPAKSTMHQGQTTAPPPPSVFDLPGIFIFSFYHFFYSENEWDGTKWYSWDFRLIV